MRRRCFSSAWRVAILLVPFLGAGLVWAQSFQRYLETVEVVQVGQQEAVRFTFSQPFQGLPVEEHSPGRFSLRFSVTGSKVPRYEKSVLDGKLLKSFVVAQSKYATTASFRLVDPEASLKGRVHFDNQGQVLRVGFSPDGATANAAPAMPSAAAPGGRDLLGEMANRIAGEDAPPAGGPAAATTGTGDPALGKFSGVDWLPTMVTLALSLGAMVLVLYGVLFLYNRFVVGRMGQKTNSQAIRQVAQFHIGPKQRVVILDINGEYIACGVTATQISFLTKLEGGRAAQRRGAAKNPSNPGSGGGSAPAAPGGAREAAGGGASRGAAAADPVQQFADALKEKVGSMKRLK